LPRSLLSPNLIVFHSPFHVVADSSFLVGVFDFSINMVPAGPVFFFPCRMFPPLRRRCQESASLFVFPSSLLLLRASLIRIPRGYSGMIELPAYHLDPGFPLIQGLCDCAESSAHSSSVSSPDRRVDMSPPPMPPPPPPMNANRFIASVN